MPLPIFAATLVGGFVAGITQFVTSRIGSVLVGLGVTSLSMVPNALKDVRATLGRYSMDEARMLAAIATDATSAGAARSQVRAALPRPPR